MSMELDEKVAKLHFLTLFSRRAGVRDDSGMSHLVRAQLGFYVQGYPGTPEVAALAVTSGTSRIRARPFGDFRTIRSVGVWKAGPTAKTTPPFPLPA